MSEYTGVKPFFLMKKMASVFLLLAGLLLTAWGFAGGLNGLAVLGILLLVGGAVLQALKIFRRNQP